MTFLRLFNSIKFIFCQCGLMVEIKNEHITSATQQDLHLDYANFFTVLPKLILEKINGRSCLCK